MESKFGDGGGGKSVLPPDGSSGSLSVSAPSWVGKRPKLNRLCFSFHRFCFNFSTLRFFSASWNTNHEYYYRLCHMQLYKKHDWIYFVLKVCVVVHCGGPEHQYSFVMFTFSGPLVWYGSTFIWEQSCAQPWARRREWCCICHYL